jgi:Sodium/hydrogen exchanger family
LDNLVPTLVLIVVALAGARISFSTDNAPLGPRLLFRTGTHFLGIGFVLGPAVLGFLTPETTDRLFPFLALGLGWVGFHFGLQLDRESLRRFPPTHYALALGQATLTFAFFAVGAYGVVRFLGLDGAIVPLLVLGAASTAAITTPAGIGMISSNFLVKGNVRDLLFFVASIDAIVGIVALQITYALYRPEAVEAGAGSAGQMVWVGAALGLGLVCGIVFLWMVRARPKSEELVLYVLGISAFAAGAALQWGLSPLLVSVTMGALVANLGRSGRRILHFLVRWEKVVYVTFLLLAGALLRIPSWWVLPAAAGYAVLRALAKLAGASLMVGLLRFPFEVPRRFGLGLVPQGGISIAMAVSAVLMYSNVAVGGYDAEAVLFSVIVIGVVLSELAAPVLTLSVLRRAGEVSPEVLAALAEGDGRRAHREALLHGSGGRKTPDVET